MYTYICVLYVYNTACKEIPQIINSGFMGDFNFLPTVFSTFQLSLIYNLYNKYINIYIYFFFFARNHCKTSEQN